MADGWLCMINFEFFSSLDDTDREVIQKCFSQRHETLDGLDFQRMVDHLKRFVELLTEIQDEIEIDNRVSFLDLATLFRNEGCIDIYHDLINQRYIFYYVPRSPPKVRPQVIRSAYLAVAADIKDNEIVSTAKICQRHLILLVKDQATFEPSSAKQIRRFAQFNNCVCAVFCAWLVFTAVKIAFNFSQSLLNDVIKLMERARQEVEHIEPCYVLIIVRIRLAIAGQILYQKTGNKLFLHNALQDAYVGLQTVSMDDAWMEDGAIIGLVEKWKPHETIEEKLIKELKLGLMDIKDSAYH